MQNEKLALEKAVQDKNSEIIRLEEKNNEIM